MKEDLSSWLPEAEVIARLGWSGSKLLRRSRQRLPPERRERPVPGRKAEIVYRPSDVEALEQEAQQVQTVLGPERPQPPAPPAIPPALASVLELIGRAIAPPPAPLPVCLNLDQAIEYTGLSRGYLLKAIHTGQLCAVRDGRWKIARAHLDEFCFVTSDSGIDSGNSVMTESSKSEDVQGEVWQPEQGTGAGAVTPPPLSSKPAQEPEEEAQASPLQPPSRSPSKEDFTVYGMNSTATASASRSASGMRTRRVLRTWAIAQAVSRPRKKRPARATGRKRNNRKRWL